MWRKSKNKQRDHHIKSKETEALTYTRTHSGREFYTRACSVAPVVRAALVLL